MRVSGKHSEKPHIVTPEEAGPTHAKSHAAHLEDTGHAHTKPVVNNHAGAQPGALRQPPMVQQRSGKQHK